jgi:hypothetical protein
MVGVDPTNVDSLNNMRAATNGDGAVGMDLDDCERSRGMKAKLGRVFQTQKHLLARFVVERLSSKVGLSELFIKDEWLWIFAATVSLMDMQKIMQ